MEIAKFGEIEIGIMTRKEIRERGIDLLCGRRIERPDIEHFAETIEEAESFIHYFSYIYE